MGVYVIFASIVFGIVSRAVFIGEKINSLLGNNSISNNDENAQPESLLPFAGKLRQPMPKGIIFNLLDYLELIDWTGRQIRENKTGSIDGNAPPIRRDLTMFWRTEVVAPLFYSVCPCFFSLFFLLTRPYI